MGNAPSSPNASAPAASPTATSAATDSSSPSSNPTGPHIVSSSQPIRSRAGTGTGSGTGTGTSAGPSGSTFHSGLTPPQAPPSPPPPGTPMLLPFAGHLSPQNPHCLSHPQAHDYSKGTVTRLILDGKLAPFYRGLEDFEEDWTIEDIGRILTDMREKDFEEGVENSFTGKLKEEREGGSSAVGSVAKKIGLNKNKEQRKELEKEERYRREKKAYSNAVECPICFLNYPPNINTSRCCQQPVCTECFVQIKRSEATITHLESDSACCPFCMETDFGVIYERPLNPLESSSSIALATSPGSEADVSGFSQALSLGSESELNLGPGMNPKTKETVRRKSVNAKSAEVVTIDEIRPDWENKLNAVKAAAARKASRRIVMRQVGDRLIPIGFTSSRAPGTADFSMSVGQQPSSESGSRRSSRRGSDRGRELEELMIEEAMRLSLMDHEDHQRKQADDRRKASVSSVSSPLNPANASNQSSSSFLGSSSNSRNSPIIVNSNSHPYSNSASTGNSSPRRFSSTETKQSGTSKLLSKINNVRARASSSASSKNGKEGNGDYNRSVTFASSTTNLGGPASASARSSPPASTTPSRTNSDQPPSLAPATAPLVVPTPINTTNTGHSRYTSASTGLSPTSPAPVAAGPITTLASPEAKRSQPQTQTYDQAGGLPRLSLDMPALVPSHPGDAAAGEYNSNKGKQPTRAPLERMDSEMSEATIGPTNYAQLDSDEE
ncbi:uncharacterized protein IL334_004011 [Kwoniella shivajii]|uniref:Zf-C3HC4 type zinc finger protein n=1 Tax=Kwoniella shivajii TaxID=564305 RepID=A0ABZ1CZ56_9TREE|nr:hypothetical protein IL334_004011 [Kwoniella shivajii]